MDDSRLLGRSCQLKSECFCSLRLSSRLSSTFSSFLDLHRAVVLTGQPNYQTARIPVFSTLNIAMWRELLSGYPDEIICEFLEFGWPIGCMSDTLPIFDLRTHRGALDFPDQVKAYLSKELKLGRPSFALGLLRPCGTKTVLSPRATRQFTFCSRPRLPVSI